MVNPGANFRHRSGAGEQQWLSFGARPAVGSGVARQVGLLESLENSTGPCGAWVNCFVSEIFGEEFRKHLFGEL